MDNLNRVPWQSSELRGELMRTPDEVAAMLHLRELGWGIRRIAKEFGCSPMTVRRYVSAGSWSGYQRPRRARLLDGLEAWLAERFRRHRGNAAVVRQDLEREHGLAVSLRTVERAVAPLRQALRSEARATVRFETPPGRQLQIDFGECWALVASDRTKLHLFVGTLGYSRRNFVAVYRHQRQSAWFAGLEAAFEHFGGVPEEVLLDNPRALVVHHDAATREVRFNERLLGFANYWGFRPRACAPYRARTKGKDERGVGYVKHNAIAGHDFASWSALEAHLAWWMREVSDVRIHGTTGEPPLERFRRDEAARLRALDGRPPFQQIRELVRRVQADCCVDLDTNAYSVPWRLIGESVAVSVSGGRVSIRHAGQEVACHIECSGRHQRLVDPAHRAGLGRPGPQATRQQQPAALLRPLAEYDRLIGGGW